MIKPAIIFISCGLSAMPVYAETVTMPIKGRIENLNDRPVEQAIAFCDERNMECPNIRALQEADPVTKVQFGEDIDARMNEIEPANGGG